MRPETEIRQEIEECSKLISDLGDVQRGSVGHCILVKAAYRKKALLWALGEV